VTDTGLIARWRTDSHDPVVRALPPPRWVNPDFARTLEAGLGLGGASERERRGLSRLHSLALLEWSVGTDLLARPLARDLALPDVPAPAVLPELSEWAMLRPLFGGWVLESAASPWRVSNGSGSPIDVIDPGWSASEWALLAAIGMTRVDDDPHVAHEWNFHDLLFAKRSRIDALQPPSPMLRGGAPAPPLHRVPTSAASPGHLRIDLSSPSGPRAGELTLFEAMEARTTIRDFSDDPVAFDDLSELLWRSVRWRERMSCRSSSREAYEGALGPVPSAGALHAIDTWVATPGVAEIPPAWWWYDPLAHQLAHVGALTPEFNSGPAMMRFTVRHARAAWKYAGFAHALELKDMGAIMMAMQLAASPLGLGVWLVGTGPTGTFARDLGIDPRSDHPVGEIVIGNRRLAGDDGEGG